MQVWERDESSGHKVIEIKGLSAVDQYVLILWDSQLDREGPRYVLPISFRMNHVENMDNWITARK